jgi:hypothetical protein
MEKSWACELLIGGAELLGITVLILSPKEVTGWSPDWTQDAWRNVKRSLSTPPVWDDDDWQLNYIGHPIAGSYYYNSLRVRTQAYFIPLFLPLPSHVFGNTLLKQRQKSQVFKTLSLHP